MSDSVDMPVLQDNARDEIDIELLEKEVLDSLKTCNNGKYGWLTSRILQSVLERCQAAFSKCGKPGS